MSNELSTHPSLCPPSHGYPPNQATPTSWVILDLHAYIADRENSTSAYGEMSNGKAIRVTFCTSPPPLVSYICIWCPDLPPDQLSMFPTIEAAEADLVLFHVSLSDDLGGGDYFVYKASGGKGPSLRRLDDARRYLQYQYCTALLACRDVGNGGHIRPHTGDDDGHYYLATLNYNPERPADFILRMYNSVDKTWSFSRPVSLCTNDSHFTSKVITLGECGSLGFIDAWRGILVCDMFGRKPDYYLPLPKHLVTFDKPGSDPKLFRDIALVDGRLTLVELHRRIDPASGTKLNSWDLSTWSISSPWEGQDGWRMEYEIKSHNVIVDDNAENAALITRLQDNGGTSHRTLGQLQLAHPILSLSDNRVVYLMGKVSIIDNKALVLYVDLENSRLKRATVFDAERMLGIAFGYTYMQSGISGYFNGAPGKRNVEVGIEKAINAKKQKTLRKNVLSLEDSAHKVEEKHPKIESSYSSAGKRNVEFEIDDAVNAKKQKAIVEKATHMKDKSSKVKKLSSTKKVESSSYLDSKDEYTAPDGAAKPTKVPKNVSCCDEEENDDDNHCRQAQQKQKPKLEVVGSRPKESSEGDSDEPARTSKKPKTPDSNQSRPTRARTLFVGNLSYNVGHEEVKQLFEEAGDVFDIRFATSYDGSFKGFAHVEFNTAEAATKALGFSGRYLMGRPIRLGVAHERVSCGSRMENNFVKKHQRSGNTLFIKGFNKSLGEEQIRSSLKVHFGSCGEITQVSIPMDYETGASKGIAYMNFRNQCSLSKACELNGSELGGFNLYVGEAKSRAGQRNGGFRGQRYGGNSGDTGRGYGRY